MLSYFCPLHAEFQTRPISRNGGEASCPKLLFCRHDGNTHPHYISSHYRFVPDVWHFWMCPASNTLLRFSFLSGQINFFLRTEPFKTVANTCYTYSTLCDIVGKCAPVKSILEYINHNQHPERTEHSLAFSQPTCHGIGQLRI